MREWVGGILIVAALLVGYGVGHDQGTQENRANALNEEVRCPIDGYERPNPYYWDEYRRKYRRETLPGVLHFRTERLMTVGECGALLKGQ